MSKHFQSRTNREEVVVARARRIKQFAEARCHSLGASSVPSSSPLPPSSDPVVLSFVRPADRHPMRECPTSNRQNQERLLEPGKGASRGGSAEGGGQRNGRPEGGGQRNSGSEGGGQKNSGPEGGAQRKSEQQRRNMEQLYETVREIAVSGGGGGGERKMSRSNTISFPNCNSSSSAAQQELQARSVLLSKREEAQGPVLWCPDLDFY
jgi:hypothetical protein